MCRGRAASHVENSASLSLLPCVIYQNAILLQVLHLVFLAFLVCWSPFFVLNMASAICLNKCFNKVPYIMDVAVWLGYCSSIANPIIYTIINKDFQKAFK